MKIEGDFYDIVVYISNLFSKQKIPEVEIAGYIVRYLSCTFRNSIDQELIVSENFPEEEQLDKIDAVMIEVSRIVSSPVRVSISWSDYEFSPAIPKQEAERFIDSMDRSTFRFF